jgi:hypothetical protein
MKSDSIKLAGLPLQKKIKNSHCYICEPTSGQLREHEVYLCLVRVR